MDPALPEEGVVELGIRPCSRRGVVDGVCPAEEGVGTGWLPSGTGPDEGVVGTGAVRVSGIGTNEGVIKPRT